ncbi:MAG: hypothetical protein ACYDH1_12255 [Anaerolineaceae bacterium]
MKNKNWKTTIIFAVILLLVFVVTRFFMTDYYTPEWSARHFLWVVVIIVLLASFFDKVRISMSAFLGYLLGLFAGELFGGFQKNIPPQFPHYGWLIQIVTFFLFCFLGIWLQYKGKTESPNRQ